MAQITQRDQAALARVARRHLKSLMRRQDVVDVGIGHRFRDGRLTTELAVVVRVDRKVALSRLPKSARVPRTVSGIRTDVIERIARNDGPTGNASRNGRSATGSTAPSSGGPGPRAMIAEPVALSDTFRPLVGVPGA